MRDHHHHQQHHSRYDGIERSSSFTRNERAYRNQSPPSQRSREPERHSRVASTSSYRPNEMRRRFSPPPPPSIPSSSRSRSDMRPSTTSIKSRLAPRVSNSSMGMRRTNVNTVKSMMWRGNDLRTGIIAKRSTAPVNRAKDYAKKIRQARLRLNENAGNTSSQRTKSNEEKSPKAKDPNESRKHDNDNDEDYLAIENEIDFDVDESEPTGGKVSKIKVKEEEANASNVTEGAGGEGNDDEEEEEESKKKKVKREQQKSSNEPSTSREGRTSRHENRVSNKRSRSRTLSKERVRKLDRIEYVCIHCNKRSTSAQEYRSHLSGRTHLLAMRTVGLRVRATLNRLRKIQREKQLEIEVMIKDVEDIPSNYCQVCKLNYRQSKEEHRESEDHKKIKSFLKPYCKICRMQLISPMKYEVHRCHTDHIRRKLKAQEASEDEMDFENMDIGDFKTVDSVGNVDDADEINDEGAANKDEEVVGKDSISKVEAHYCSLCHDFICRSGDEREDRFILDHCKSRRHLSRYHDRRREEERKEARNAKRDKESAEKSSTASKQNGSDVKHEKNDSNEVDRDADVNLDDNTYGSEPAEDN